MCTKVPKEKSLVAINVRKIYIDGLTGPWQDPGLQIWNFIRAQKLTEQAATVKKIGQEIKEADNITPVLDVLIDTYLQCPPKHQIKRAIASCLQNVSSCQPCVEEVMKTHIMKCLQPPDDNTPRAQCRTTIDNCNSLLENFPLGERCLQCLLQEALTFLHQCLERFYKESKIASTAVALTESMHNCHLTMQVWNKLVARTEWLFDQDSDVSKMLPLVSDFFSMAWKILTDGDFLMDCRAACGMALPLILKVVYKGHVVEQAIHHLFPTTATTEAKASEDGSSPILKSHKHLLDKLDSAKPTTLVCVTGGCLAMLETSHLASEPSPGISLLVEVIGQQLVGLIEKMYEVSSKVLLSRTLVLWTSKAVQTLEESLDIDHRCLNDSLRGEAALPTVLMEYAWTHWEDATDVIRHQARLIFDNLLKCHLLATGEEPSKSEFLFNLLKSLMSTGWQQRGRYGPLCCLVGHLGTAVILRQMPDLPRHLLSTMGDQTLAGYISELYEKLYSAHRRELCAMLTDPEGHMRKWQVTWVDPILEALCEGGRLQRTHIIEYVLPKLLKHSPDIMPYITTKLTQGEMVGPKLGALVTCLKRAKMIGLLHQKPLESNEEEADYSTQWYGVVSVEVLKMSLCHQNEQLRLDAFGLLVENLKTTEVLTPVDLELITFFLPLNTSSQSPSFRQHLAALLKKLFIRLRDGAQSLRRKAASGNKEAANDLVRYKDFIEWFLKHQFESLYLGASFPCRTVSLNTLSIYTEIMLEKGTTNHKDVCEFALSNYIRPEQIQTLLECLSDSFEQNKMDCYKVLISLPYQKLYLTNEERLESLLQTGLALAASTRPQDSTTAAYLLRVLLTQPGLTHAAANSPSIYSNDTNKEVLEDTEGVTEEEVSWARHLLVLEILVKQLERQLEVAQRSLIHAAATEPLYPTLLCIRYLLNDVNLRVLAKSGRWRKLIAAVINISFKVAHVVSPVVSNSSPEGNVPLGPGLALEAVVQSPGDAEALKGAADSVRTVSLIPEYLVVCCWRSIKECSLLLGQLTLTAPLVDPHGDLSTGLITVSQLHELGDYFTTQLLESRHRGAFELAYAGFVKMTEMLWKCPLAEVQALPRQWLVEIMKDIKSRDPNNRLCATRRSAGVPFYVQALVSAEPVTTGRSCFKQLMSELLELAVPAQKNPTTEDPAQVHALNVLRALYRDTRLGDDVFPYVTGGLQAAILGYSSQLWGIRNSATLLFSALMTRIFGVKRSKDEMSKKNCLTGRVFFHRFPALYQFLLDQMEAGTSNIGSGGVYQLHPGLYPVLMVLARLYPSVVEGSNTTLNTAAFVPYVIKCASSPVYKTRLMAARAIRPLVGKDQITTMLASLLEYLPTRTVGATSQNMLHGILLQLKELAESVAELPVVQAGVLLTTLSESLLNHLWIITNQNPCIVTRKAFAELCFVNVSIADSLYSQDNANFKLSAVSKIKEALLRQTMEQLFVEHLIPATPELSEYHQNLARHLLVQTSLKDNSQDGDHCKLLEGNPVVQSPGGDCVELLSNSKKEILEPPGGDTVELLSDSEDLVHLVVRVLRSAEYEVRLEGLDFLSRVFPDQIDLDTQENSERTKSKINESNKRMIQESQCIYHQLVTMAMTEDHAECLTKVLELLCNHGFIHTTPWIDATLTSHNPLEIMKRLAECKKHTSDDVRCAAHELSACLIPHLYKEAAQGSSEALGVLSDWCRDLERRCATQESVSSRLTVAISLLNTGPELLTDPSQILGQHIYDVWTVVVRLLQDEDIDVRQVAARVVCGIAMPEINIKSDVDGVVPQPLVVLDSVAFRLMALRTERDWRGLFDCLLRWILHDIEPEWPQQEEKEVRLFDKGEMNTYRDEMLFVKMVTKHFKAFLKNSVGHDSESSTEIVPAGGKPNSADDGQKTAKKVISSEILPNAKTVVSRLRQKIIANKVEELLGEFSKKVTVLKTVRASAPFLMTSQYQENIVCLCRLKMAISCLLSVARQEPEKTERFRNVLSDVNLKFSEKDSQQNVLMTHNDSNL